MLPPLFLVQTAINFEDTIKMYFSKKFHTLPLFLFFYIFSLSHSCVSFPLSFSLFGHVKEEEKGQCLLPAINFAHCRFPPHSDRKTAQVIINPKCCYLCFSQHIFCLLECVATQPRPFCLQTALSNTPKEMCCIVSGQDGKRDGNGGKKRVKYTEERRRQKNL